LRPMTWAADAAPGLLLDRHRQKALKYGKGNLNVDISFLFIAGLAAGCHRM
jgi:hypothetical protein